MFRQPCSDFFFFSLNKAVEVQQPGQTKGKAVNQPGRQGTVVPAGTLFQQCWVPPAETTYTSLQRLESAKPAKRCPESTDGDLSAPQAFHQASSSSQSL